MHAAGRTIGTMQAQDKESPLDMKSYCATTVMVDIESSLAILQTLRKSWIDLLLKVRGRVPRGPSPRLKASRLLRVKQCKLSARTT